MQQSVFDATLDVPLQQLPAAAMIATHPLQSLALLRVILPFTGHYR